MMNKLVMALLGGAVATLGAQAARAEYVINTGDTINPNGIFFGFDADRPYAVGFTVDQDYTLTSASALATTYSDDVATFRFGIARDLGGIPGSGQPGPELFGCTAYAGGGPGVFVGCDLSGTIGAGSYFLTLQTDILAYIGSGAGNFSSPVYRVSSASDPRYFQVPFPSQFLLQGDPAGVPEPASWAMMIGGMGLAGGALRRGRAHARVAIV